MKWLVQWLGQILLVFIVVFLVIVTVFIAILVSDKHVFKVMSVNEDGQPVKLTAASETAPATPAAPLGKETTPKDEKAPESKTPVEAKPEDTSAGKDDAGSKKSENSGEPVTVKPAPGVTLNFYGYPPAGQSVKTPDVKVPDVKTPETPAPAPAPAPAIPSDDKKTDETAGAKKPAEIADTDSDWYSPKASSGEPKSKSEDSYVDLCLIDSHGNIHWICRGVPVTKISRDGICTEYEKKTGRKIISHLEVYRTMSYSTLNAPFFVDIKVTTTDGDWKEWDKVDGRTVFISRDLKRMINLGPFKARYDATDPYGTIEGDISFASTDPPEKIP